VRKPRNVGRAAIPRRDVPPNFGVPPPEPADPPPEVADPPPEPSKTPPEPADPPPGPGNTPSRPAGTAKVGKAVGKAVRLERAHTELIGSLEDDRPVFVDPSGLRRRRLRWLAYVLALLLVIALALVWWSQLGGTSSKPPNVNQCTATAQAGCSR
jgi:hypothetical protein